MQQGMQQPTPMPMPAKHSGLGTTSLILGIIALILTCLAFVPWVSFLIWVGLILGILAIIFGAIAYWGQWKDKYGMIGFILGLVAVIIFIVLLIIGIFIYASLVSSFG